MIFIQKYNRSLTQFSWLAAAPGMRIAKVVINKIYFHDQLVFERLYWYWEYITLSRYKHILIMQLILGT